MIRWAAMGAVAWLMAAGSANTQTPTREQKVRSDRQKVESDGFWIYDDLPRGFAEARKTGKPLFVTMRCIPCEECVKLDDELIEQNDWLRPLLEKFVRVRVVSTNGLDLSLFQFDTDQSFAAFLLNADGTIYGRFGTRSHRTEWSDDVSIEGLATALDQGLELHAKYPANKASLAGKRGPAPEFASPELFPMLTGRYGSKLSADGQIVPSCIHCHQIGEAERQLVRQRRGQFDDKLLFPYPHPKSIGLIFDPKERARVVRIVPGSIADQAGFKQGDVIPFINGQPILSIADIQWVLHQVPPEGGELRASRGEKELQKLKLPPNWRRLDTPSWRTSYWSLRRMATGGMVLETATPAERRTAGIEEKTMALRVKSVGQYGPHAAAKNAGFRQGDLVTSFDGRTDFSREADLIAHALNARPPGDTVAVKLLRDGKRLELKLPMQE